MEQPSPLDGVWAHADDVARLAWQLRRHREDAEDVAQSSLLKAAECIDGFRGEATMRTWLHRITTYECRMLRRRLLAGALDDILEHVPTRATLPVSAVEASPDELAEERVLAATVLQTVSELPARQRNALILLEGAGLTIAEVARRLDTSVPAVRSLLVRARRTMCSRIATPLRPAPSAPSGGVAHPW